ncbi:MAG: hypothetical protein AAB439_01115 [Patescibacteria group bacterium]
MNKPRDMKKGVYTAQCANCGQPNYMHIDGEGGFDPRRCRSCKASFFHVGEGERKNEYIAYVKEKGRSSLEEDSKNGNVPIKIQRKEFSKSNIEKKDKGSFRLKVNSED